ncbi:hypothetical protein DAPPUDRAFT_118686 [Daphnia pulex]|uniref:Uncharacterized protein n=1 Tax=Daphnia pulex TaxID=6669 RepID=E9HWD4_DAPPU|nr:hypothetical protein DAPPUDRAFT_118686 [Daphnia pulex]|eukprot:EFX63947.1 hypothetical protein DAPPUDRAFT_118686 [Daphnia pulex]
MNEIEVSLTRSANEVDGAEVIYSKMDGDQARAVPEGRNEDGLQMKKGSEAIYPKMDGDQARAVPEEGNEDVYLKVKFSWDENAKSKRKKSFLLIKNSKRPKKEDKAQNIDGEAELCDVFSDFCNNDDSRGSLIVGQPDNKFHGFNTISPPFSPPVSFLNSWTISERQRIEERGRFNKAHEMQLKLKYEKMNSNREQFYVQATLEKFVRNGALVKKELSSYRSQIFKDGVEAKLSLLSTMLYFVV